MLGFIPLESLFSDSFFAQTTLPRIFLPLKFLIVITFNNGRVFIHLYFEETMVYSVVVLSTEDFKKLFFLMLRLNF